MEKETKSEKMQERQLPPTKVGSLQFQENEQEREKSRQLLEYWQLRALTAEGKFEKLQKDILDYCKKEVNWNDDIKRDRAGTGAGT